MEGLDGKRVSESVENAANYATSAVQNVTALCRSAASAVERKAHTLVQSVRESADNEAVVSLKSAIVAKCKEVPSGAWFLISLGMAGVLLASGGEKKKNCGSRHPSICHCVQMQEPAFHFVQPLKRRTFCAQDIFDVEATITGFGNPQWENTHSKATKSADVLEILKKSGAKFIGKTVMDELGFSLIGNNRWLDVPKNPAATNRICGGASSGAAIAAASDIVDFALGIDTVGDIRVPAACCGILGFRASHGVISMVGVIPVSLASSCDAVGWFARDSGMLLQVGRQLCASGCTPPSEADETGPKRFYMAHDVFKLLSLPHSRTADVISRSVCRTVGHLLLQDFDLLNFFEANVPSIQVFKNELDRMSIESSQYTAIDVLRESMLLFHRYEFKSNHGGWIAKVKPVLTTTVEVRVQKAVFSPSSEALRLIAVKIRDEMRTVMDTLLKDDAVLVVPTLPSFPPNVDAPADELELFEYKTHALMSLASISGCCEAVIPVGSYGSPMSVSLLARKGADLLLLDTVYLLHTTIQQEVLLSNDPNLPISKFLGIK